MTEQANTEQQEAAWVRAQFQKANKFMAEKGILPGKVVMKESRVLAPLVAVWKIEENGPRKRRFWVLSGDLPTDIIPESTAPNAREVLRHFSLAWQLKAENLIRSPDKTQQDLARMLVSRAEGLGNMHQDERIWEEMPMVN
ncbi:DUF4826 family protein [Ferrimonas balearica]|uniref:DUF4826 family protein n=1 Tax=Ferrimonas balearica TaxID=44012 RepID=UPI001C9A0755|nr:DUF4826 family protein [Ferrimonas balearica]MBY5920313.1 DUF4826 family protein [Ferrimonas balearica]MBY5997002.1 DUF4826 family protein [Ferrimonas balearica]